MEVNKYWRISLLETKKNKFKKIKELKIINNSFLSFIEEYDNSLKQNINNL